MAYETYQPQIDVADGKKRVMNNMKLYLRLVGMYEGKQLTDQLIKAMQVNDNPNIIHLAHALRGTAANLSFTEIKKIMEEIEYLAKSGETTVHLTDKLTIAAKSLEEAINRLTAENQTQTKAPTNKLKA